MAVPAWGKEEQIPRGEGKQGLHALSPQVGSQPPRFFQLRGPPEPFVVSQFFVVSPPSTSSAP